MNLEPLVSIRVEGVVDSAANLREHKGDKAARVKRQRNLAHVVTLAQLRTLRVEFALPLTIVVTRAAPRRLDSDNLASAVKAHRDGATLAIKQHLKDLKRPAPKDDSDQLTWLYDQKRCAGGDEHLRVSLYESECVAKWMLRHLPTEPSALERWIVAHAGRLDALLVREVAR